MEDETKAAPHGRDPETGKPLTPYGTNVDGSPRKSNRGARPGQRGNRSGASGRSRARAGAKPGNQTDAVRKALLVQYGEMAFVAPLTALSLAPVVVTKFGQGQADAFAGDAVILSQFLPPLADGLIVLGQSKPGALAWLDQVEEKAPYLLLATVGIQLGKALVSNHMNPNPDLARAGRLQAAMNQAAWIQEVERAASEMGIDFGAEPTVVIPEDQAA